MLAGIASGLGDTRRVFREALSFGVGASVGPTTARYRLKLTIEAHPVASTTIGTITSFRAVAGGSFTWLSRLSGSMEIGPAMRRIALSDELTNRAWGASAVAELSWRLASVEAWAITLGARSGVTSFSSDGFLWMDFAVLCAVQRAFGPFSGHQSRPPRD